MGKLRRVLHRTVVIFLFAALVGALGGLVAVGFQELMELATALISGRSGGILEVARGLDWWQRLLMPTAGGLAGAVIVRHLARRATPFGVADIMEVVSLRKMEIRNRPTLARVASSLAVLSTGGSVGREGPIGQLCATVAHNVARIAGLDPRRKAILLGCGIAAGIAASYNAPLAGAFFVMEIILGNFAMDVFAPVVVAAIMAMLVMRQVRGEDLPLFAFPEEVVLVGLGPVLTALLLGVVAGVVAVLFQKLLHLGGRAFSLWKAPLAAKGAAGGAILGAMGVYFPEVWGNGYQATTEMLGAALPLMVVGALFFMKPLATAVTVGSGGSGGILTPTLFLGAAAGILFGAGMAQVFPGMEVPSAGYATLGMAALLAGTTHAPIMSVVMLFEMTRDQGILLPLVLACVASSLTARSLGRDSIYTEKLRARGVPVDAGIEELTLYRTHVRDLMRADLQAVTATATLDEILQRFQKTRRDIIYVVGPKGDLQGHVNLHDVKEFINQAELGSVVIAADVMRSVSAVGPGESIAEVMEKFDEPDLEELPVTVTRDGASDLLIGRITRRDVIACLNLEVLHRQSLRAKFIVEGQREPTYVELPSGYSLARVLAPKEMWGKTLAESGMKTKHSLTVMAVVETGGDRVEKRIVPAPDLTISARQSFVVMGRDEDIASFRQKDRKA